MENGDKFYIVKVKYRNGGANVFPVVAKDEGELRGLYNNTSLSNASEGYFVQSIEFFPLEYAYDAQGNQRAIEISAPNGKKIPLEKIVIETTLV